VIFGGDATQRGKDLASYAAKLFEFFGLLNKGSADAPAAPDPDAAGQTQSVSSNSLNMTRVGGVTSVIAGAGAAALVLFKVDRASDPQAIVAAAYASTGIIVTAALLTVAIIISADIRARSKLAASAQPSSQPPSEVLAVRGAKTTEVAPDRAYACVLVDASDGDVRVKLPSAAANPWRQMTLRRTDEDQSRHVHIEPVAGEDSLALTVGDARVDSTRPARSGEDSSRACSRRGACQQSVAGTRVHNLGAGPAYSWMNRRAGRGGRTAFWLGGWSGITCGDGWAARSSSALTAPSTPPAHNYGPSQPQSKRHRQRTSAEETASAGCSTNIRTGRLT
jgi:hypothetical protein